MSYYPKENLGWMFMVGLITGLLVTLLFVTALKPAFSPGIQPELLRVADHVCRNNRGPKVIDHTWKLNVFNIHCEDGAVFHRVEAKFEEKKIIVGGAEIVETK